MKLRSGRGIVRHFAGGRVLLGHRAVDVVEYRADRLDRLRDAVHGVDRARGVALQRLDLLGDLLGGVLGLHRERLDLGGDHRETAPGLARARRLDGGVERQQRGLPRDLRDQIDDVADRGRGFPQAIDVGAGFARSSAGLVGELAGVAHLGADALRRMGELVGGLREGRRRGLRGAGAAGQGVGSLADGGKRCGGRLRAAGNRLAARSSWRIIAPSSSSSSSRISLAESLAESLAVVTTTAEMAGPSAPRPARRVLALAFETNRTPWGLIRVANGARHPRIRA